MELRQGHRSDTNNVEITFETTREAGLYDIARYRQFDPRSISFKRAITRLANGSETVIQLVEKPSKLRRAGQALLALTPDTVPAYYDGNSHLPTGAAQQLSYQSAMDMGSQISQFLAPATDAEERYIR
ncbi:hypothetical protein KBD20_03420 [Candidatus Saccharibacteria bacterium]|nr:hypothetical protein [Candidatus Saccharibacteria bacterium]